MAPESALPEPVVTVHALSAGSLTLPERFFVHPSDSARSRTVPSIAFLIQHISADGRRTTRILFDLGIRNDLSAYPLPILQHCESRQPITSSPDVVASLARGGLTPADIDYVILSHVHWDHVGTPSAFSNAHTRFVVGPGALDLLSGHTKIAAASHSHFEADLLPLERTIELPDPVASTANKNNDTSKEDALLTRPWRPLLSSSAAVLPHTIDLFSDQSIYLVHAPGHLPGHVNLLIRPSSASRPLRPTRHRRAIYLAGDACHDRRLLAGTHAVAEWTDAHGRTSCIHADKATAADTLRRIRELAARGARADADGREEESEQQPQWTQNGEGSVLLGEVEVVFAHDADWADAAHEAGRFWPGAM